MTSEPVHLCASAALTDQGPAVVFDVRQAGAPARAFALRHRGRVVAYLNRCVHMRAELDWQPGEFRDSANEFILCSLHGATYAPHSGRCIGGPGVGASLSALLVEERGGEVYWYPTRDICRVVATASNAKESAA